MRIIIAGDLYIADEFRNNNLIDKSVIDLFEDADYRIVNLEAPITEDNPNNKIIKTGPHLRMLSNTILPYLHQLKIDAVTMANNHIQDYGNKGVTDTFKELDDHKIEYIGAGNDLTEARKPLTLDKDGMKIAILNFCENEWSIADDDSPGANPMDIIDNTNQIREAKASHDKVIVIIHGGHEYYNLPSPRMQKQYRFYADQGADIVVGHHTHCISGNEVYKGVPIYYSLGNFLFTNNNINDDWYTGLVLEIEISNEKIECEIHPIGQKREKFDLTLLEGIFKEDVLNRFKTYCKLIENPDKIRAHWVKYIEKQSKQYLNYWSPLASIENRYISGIFRRIGVNFINKKAASLHLNLMRCEAHHNLSKEVLEKYISK
ncbi:MAG: CapA family protein [Peptostreptococcales bacterium]